MTKMTTTLEPLGMEVKREAKRNTSLTTSTTRRCVLRSCLEGVPAGGGPACYRVRSAGHTHT